MPTIPTIRQSPGDSSWFVNDRFGLFIHWGLYALPARHEWIKNYERIRDEDYQKYCEYFDQDLYDPVEWARIARASGMKYAVFTTKHHEGFCLWDSALTDYKAPNTPAGRDLLRPWVEAFRAEGLKIGFYHSLIDWHHPDFTVDFHHPQRDDDQAKAANSDRQPERYTDYLHGQVRELMTGFGEIDILWLDFSYPRTPWGTKGRDDWQSEKLVAMIRALQPGILLNDRMDLPEQSDLATPEQWQPRGWVTSNGVPTIWEACQTLNGSWGYDRDNLNWKSPELLVQLLIDTVSKGGNLLLNVGPNARGEFEPRAVSTLATIGEWIRLHGRAIYGATMSEYTPPPDGRYTQRGNRLYLHLFSWPYGHVHLDGLRDRVAYAQFLHDGSEVRFAENDDPFARVSDLVAARSEDLKTVSFKLPVQRPNVVVPVIELFLREPV